MMLTVVWTLLFSLGVAADHVNILLNIIEADKAPQPLFVLPIATEHEMEQVKLNRSERHHQGTCTWTWKGKKCVPSEISMLALVEQSESELARVSAPFLRRRWAAVQPKGKAGDAISKRELEYSAVVDILDFLETRSGSPCYKNATALWNLTMHSEACKQHHKHRRGCFEDPLCTWTWHRRKCNLDTWNMIFGVKSKDNTPAGFNKALAQHARLYSDAFEEKFGDLMPEEDFNWNLTLEWQGPEFVCPPGVAQTVCDYAEPYIKTFPKAMYCAGKYLDPFGIHECQRDVNCEPSIDADPLCVPAERWLLKAAEEARKVFIDDIEDKFVQDVFRMSSLCASIGGSGFNCRYAAPSDLKCQWDQQAEVCGVSTRWIAEKLKKPKDTDPLCRLFEIPRRKCMKQEYSFGCAFHAHSCHWNRRQGVCETKLDVFLDRISKEDPGLQQKMENLKAICRQRKRRQCKIDPQ